MDGVGHAVCACDAKVQSGGQQDAAAQGHGRIAGVVVLTLASAAPMCARHGS
jgi:hypothetical protein